jgi:DNA transformation protein and related proteins
MAINELTSLPNIGKTLADKLIRAGIKTPDELKSAGSENAFIKLYTIENDACLNMLFALEGAIQGIRWHNLDKSTMMNLKLFYNHLSRSGS